MKITVINGSEKHGVTYRLKEAFLENFRGKAEITEFNLPTDGPGFCIGCTACFRNEESRCKDAECVRKIEKALLEADLLVFTSPTYCFHATGAMKVMLDHFGYRWMPHRPAKEMFGKRAVIITQALGAGEGSAAKDMRDSLSWWGISCIKTLKFKLMGDILWDNLTDKKRQSMTNAVNKTARRFAAIDYGRRARTNLITKCKFYMVRFLQKGLGKKNPEYTDYKYWKANGWLGKARPWKAA